MSYFFLEKKFTWRKSSWLGLWISSMKSFSLHGNEMSKSLLNSQAFIKKTSDKISCSCLHTGKGKKHFTNLVYFSDPSRFTKIRCGSWYAWIMMHSHVSISVKGIKIMTLCQTLMPTVSAMNILCSCEKTVGAFCHKYLYHISHMCFIKDDWLISQREVCFFFLFLYSWNSLHFIYKASL